MEQELDLMIVDEAERLNQQSLEMIRVVYDQTEVPIVLIGMMDIVSNHRSHKKFYRRIGIAYHYESLSYEQLAEYLDIHHPLLKKFNPVLKKSY